MIEKIALFGESRNLVGVITQPGDGPAPDFAFVLLNAGVIHHVGPNRINVKLARRLADSGFTVMRFDLSGIGDSRASQSTLSFEAQAVARYGGSFWWGCARGRTMRTRPPPTNGYTGSSCWSRTRTPRGEPG